MVRLNLIGYIVCNVMSLNHCEYNIQAGQHLLISTLTLLVVYSHQRSDERRHSCCICMVKSYLVGQYHSICACGQHSIATVVNVHGP